MTWWRLVRARGGGARSVPVALAAVVALVAVLLAAVLGGASAVVAAGLHAAVERAPARDRGLEVAVRRDPAAPQEQDRLVRAVLARTFEGTTTAVARSDRGELLGLPGRDERLVPWAAGDLRTHAVLTAGRWPAAPATAAGGAAPLEAVLQADAAAALGVSAGDTLRPEPPDTTSPSPPPVAVVGLWRVRDARDPYWLADRLALTGTERAGVLGPLAFDPAAVPAVPGTWTARWVVVPRPDSVDPGRLDRLTARVAGLQDALGDVPAAGGSPAAVTRGGLAALLQAQIAPQRRASSALAAVLALLVATATALCLLAAGLLAELRGGEWSVLRVRGADATQRAALGLREAAALALPACVPAVAVSAGVAVLTGARGGALLRACLASLAVALLAGLLVAVLTEVAQARLARRGQARGERAAGPSGAGDVAALLAVAAAAGLAAWQLAGARAADLAGRAATDPVLTVAVPALLAGGAVVIVAVLAVAARPVARLSGRSGVVASLTAWHVARRAARPAAPLVVLVLGAAAAVCALGSASSIPAAARERAALRVAPDAAVVTSAPPGTADRAGTGAGAPDAVTAAVAAVPGVRSSAAVVALDGTVGDRPVRLLAVDAALLPALTAGARAARVPATVARTLSAPAADPSLVPALVPSALADALGVPAGAGVTVVDAAGRPLALEVAVRAPAVPGDPAASAPGGGGGSGSAPDVLLVDRARLEAAQRATRLQPRPPRQWWVVGTPDEAALARAVAPAVLPGAPAPVVVTRRGVARALLDDPLAGGLRTLQVAGGVALGAAAVAALVLGQVVSTRRRRTETAALRAVGLSGAQVRRLLAGESAGLGAVAVGVGAALGLAAAPLVVPVLAAQPPASPVVVDAGATLAVVVVLVVAAAVVGVVAGRVAVRQDVPGVLREEVR